MTTVCRSLIVDKPLYGMAHLSRLRRNVCPAADDILEVAARPWSLRRSNRLLRFTPSDFVPSLLIPTLSAIPEGAR